MPKSKITKHKHHIIPKHMGGADDEDNLILLTIEEHIQAHWDLYQKYGKIEDLCAYYLLKGDGRGHEICSKLGGLKSGKKHKESGHMRKISLERTKEERIRIGKKSADTCRKKQVNSFFDPVLRNIACKKGGEVQGKNNAESGHLKQIANDYWNKVKSGEITRKKRIWISSSDLKISKQILENEEIPNGFHKGRKF
jgi:hypothetical protein